GACGKHNTAGDFIVALNQAQWDNGAHCWKMINIDYAGKSLQAQIVDLCPGCKPGGLDLSPAVFNSFASPDEGNIFGSWTF
ncbi:RlpA-like double-psi beta-barrel-protein domain-containing protein-containing protein, partial [Amylostereum chailletii]